MRRDGHPGRAWTTKGKSLPEHQTPDLTDFEACREAWETARNPEGLWWGIVHCSASGGLPQWLAAALLTMLKLKPVQRRLWAPYQQRLVDFVRFAEVRAARARGLTWEAARDAASKACAQSPAAGSAEAMKRSYRLVASTSAQRLGGYARRPPKE
jgi:hypothetical protein